MFTDKQDYKNEAELPGAWLLPNHQQANKINVHGKITGGNSHSTGLHTPEW